MLNAKIRTMWDRGMRPVGSLIGRSGISPNAVTLVGLGVQAVSAGLILQDRLVGAGFVLIASALLDTVDGAVAKARGMTSKFGALLDSTTDRLADALVFLPVAWLYLTAEAYEGEEWVGALAMTAMVFSFCVSYVKARAEGLGFECNVGLIERAERLILMILGLVFTALLPVMLGVLAVASLWTFLQRVWHVRKQASRAV
ncbi:MAG: CDP-alcohol phosphatidyltransferase family protein [Actinomycetota bacterium]